MNNDFERSLATRRLFLFGDLKEGIAKQLVELLLILDEDRPGEEITLFINSPGGDCYSALALHNTFRMLRCDVATFTLGAAESAAAFVAACGTPGKRYAGRASYFMYHQVGWEAQAGVTEMEIRTRQARGLNDQMDRILARITHRPVRQICADFERERWFTAREAKAYGLIDHIR